MLLTWPNIISFSRFPLALLFLQDNPAWRLCAIVLALLSDGLDGFLARRQRMSSTFGTLLDPLADKFFVMFVAIILMGEGKLQLWQAVALACRDISVLLFGTYLIWNKRLVNYKFRSIHCGKITTFLQFMVLLCLLLNITIPSPLYIMFILLGLLSLVELTIPKRV
jgi:CDP-diacylglycerol---glycerol-3-phosphate 3-phosphatidyltransferase